MLMAFFLLKFIFPQENKKNNDFYFENNNENMQKATVYSILKPGINQTCFF